ncbi:MAG: hypothetical protein N2037_04945 [Acidimicrobiales bacterium]|nr:hypothetical protein [Acidimicrobiales bacterium]
MNVFAIILWVWLAVSLSVYAFRFVRWLLRKTTGTPTTADSVPSAGSSTSTRAADLQPSAPPVGTAPLAFSLSMPDDQLTPTQRLFKEAAEQQRREAAGESTSTGLGGPPSHDSSGRTGLFAPKEPPQPPAQPASSKPIAELLRGINMPCDLVPVIDPSALDAQWRVAFSTRGFAPAEVGAQVGDELERLGYSLRSVSDTEVMATRGPDVLTVRLITNPEAARREDRPAFPTLAPGSLVVEFSSR